ncbi:hypothetical protein [Actinocatenispora rupis]|uniref:Uncharacterized protein n=1 Tax=Actinocatenispora rupis TaxID=519421 RepID=A0A8J3JAR6_9ACTN|nr:hypothetical protein [Actinocatenispora rupis]GID14972.1 hypothetical protein Aru02nite_58610 [Actinocatenispora rupis]
MRVSWWRVGAVSAAVVPTAVTIAAAPWRRSSTFAWAGSGDIMTTVRLLNAWFVWQSVVVVAVPALIVLAAGLVPVRLRRPATLVAAVLLAVATAVAVAMAYVRTELTLPAGFPIPPVAAAWTFVPCYAAAAVLLVVTRRRTETQ